MTGDAHCLCGLNELQQPISQCDNGASAVTSPALCAACPPSWPACLSPRRNLRCLVVLQVSPPWQCSRRSPSPLLYIVCCDHSFMPGIMHNRATLAAPVVPASALVRCCKVQQSRCQYQRSVLPKVEDFLLKPGHSPLDHCVQM